MICNDCQVELVEELAEPNAELNAASELTIEKDLVPIVSVSDPFEISAVKKILEDLKIPYLARRDCCGDECSAVLGHGSDEEMSELAFLVSIQDEEVALEALSDFLESDPETEEIRFEDLPPELAGGDEPLPGELDDEQDLLEFGGEEDENFDDGESEGSPSECICKFCQARFVASLQETRTIYATCPACHRTFHLGES